MNAAEKITAAIEKLEERRSRATAGEWWVSPGSSWVFSGPGLSDDLCVVDDARLPEDAQLIVTLHRTIDAQLAILREAARTVTDDHHEHGRLVHRLPALDLARAILGEVA